MVPPPPPPPQVLLSRTAISTPRTAPNSPRPPPPLSRSSILGRATNPLTREVRDSVTTPGLPMHQRGLARLAVDHAGARARFPPHPLTNQHQQGMVQALPSPIIAPGIKIA